MSFGEKKDTRTKKVDVKLYTSEVTEGLLLNFILKMILLIEKVIDSFLLFPKLVYP